jgi:hypothetical protein
MSDSEPESEAESEVSEIEEVIPKKPIAKKLATDAKPSSDNEDSDAAEDSSDSETETANNDSDDDLSISDDDEIKDPDEEDAIFATTKKKQTKKTKKIVNMEPEDEDDNSLHLGELELSDDEEDEDDEEGLKYMQQFDENVKEQLIENHHPELLIHNYDEVESLSPTHTLQDDPINRPDEFPAELWPYVADAQKPHVKARYAKFPPERLKEITEKLKTANVCLICPNQKP